MEYEQAMTLFHVQRIEDMKWDATNSALVVMATVGPMDERKSTPLAFSLSPEAAQSLADVLPIAIEERPAEGSPRQ